jgi:dCTP deaminase
MTVLVDWQLQNLIQQGTLKVLPLADGAIQPNSIDVRLGYTFATYVGTTPIDPYEEASVLADLMTIQDHEVTISKGAFLLAETLEVIELPNNICAVIEGKSSLARLGLTVHQTGGWVDCGFKGNITLEMTNENARPIILRTGMPIAQIVFMQTESAKNPYHSINGAKYVGQHGVTASRFYLNKRIDI